MSASLVGSEMCIRDRCRPRPVAAPPNRQPPQMGGTLAQLWELRSPNSFACLLYTSDAADDM
eukprot:6918484-Alexandrium_andersonii.AAC.1